MIPAIILIWLGALAIGVVILAILEPGNKRPRDREADGLVGERERGVVHGSENVR